VNTKKEHYQSTISFVILIFSILIIALNSFHNVNAGMNGNSDVAIGILGSVAIEVSPTELNMGNLQVKAGFPGANCTAGWAVGAGPWNNSGCDVVPSISPIQVTNIGNVPVTLDINSTKNATQYFEPYANTPVATPLFQVNVTGDYNIMAGCEGLPDHQIDLNSTVQRICDHLNVTGTNPGFEVDLTLGAPVESLAGSRNATLSVFAAEV
jgi:hypothetical protein